MRSLGFVLDSVPLCQPLCFLRRGKQFDVWPPAGSAYWNSTLNRPLKDFINGFSQGGGLAGCTPFPNHSLCITPAMRGQ